MSWNHSDDQEQYRAARELNARRGRLWMVMWAPELRAYVGFYLGPEAVPWQGSPTVGGLAERMRRIEQELAAPAPPAPHAPTGFWTCPERRCSWASVNPMPHPCPVRGPSPNVRVPPATPPAAPVSPV